MLGLALLSALQIALGGWVSTNYAVLACTDFPTCHGQWWPPMDFTEGFAPFRHLGLNAQGTALEMDALTAIHYTHRLMAYAVLAALLALACGKRPRVFRTWCWAGPSWPPCPTRAVLRCWSWVWPPCGCAHAP